MMATRPGSRPPRKIFHKIGEVCDLTKTEPYVLRYWESEFPFLAPEKNRAGQRIYTDDDIETVLAIKRLLYEEGYTTAGARRRLEKEREDRAAHPGAEEGALVALALPSTGPLTGPPTGPGSATSVAEPTVDGEAPLRRALREVRDGLRGMRAALSGDASPAISPTGSATAPLKEPQRAPRRGRK